MKKGTKIYGRFIEGTDCKSAPAGEDISREFPSERVNMTDLIGLTVNTRLGTFGIGSTYEIPAFYFDWLVRNHEREEQIRTIKTGLTIASFAIGGGKVMTVVRVGRGIFALRVGNMIIATGDLVLLNQRIEETMRGTGFLEYWELISLASYVRSLNLRSVNAPGNLFYGLATVFDTYRLYLRENLEPSLYRLLIELMNEIDNDYED